MGCFDDHERMLPTCVHHDFTIQGCAHLDTVNRIWIHLKKGLLTIPAPRFLVDHTIEDIPLCDAAAGLATSMVTELRVHAAANVVELFVQTFVVLRTIPILDSGLKTFQHDPLSPCRKYNKQLNSVELFIYVYAFVEDASYLTLSVNMKDNLVALHFKYDQARRRFVEWAQNEIAVVPDFHKRILLSDEAHFWLNGYVNKQNCRIWSEGNPQVYVETPLHPEKLTVWCALWAGGILLQKR
ncbi:transposable element Tc3 transposase [Trichonephila clavipes]|nr:transposable element Tc3 transposase [Trichonephila clavipes]